MTAFALALVLTSAVMHATWNLLAKRVNAGTPFLFLVYVIGAVAYTPFAIAVLVIARPELGLITIAFVVVAILLQTVYFATLTAGYRAGDLSLVYPIARATGPLLATAGAIAILGERPSPLAIAGALAIVLGARCHGRSAFAARAERPSPSATRSRPAWSSRCTRSGTRRPYRCC